MSDCFVSMKQITPYASTEELPSQYRENKLFLELKIL